MYIAVLPIIIITCRKAGSFLVGVIIAFVYGYGGMFAAGNMTLAKAIITPTKKLPALRQVIIIIGRTAIYKKKLTAVICNAAFKAKDI